MSLLPAKWDKGDCVKNNKTSVFAVSYTDRKHFSVPRVKTCQYLTFLRYLLRNGDHLLPRDAMLARYMLWPCVCLSVCLCLCLSQVGVLLKQLNGFILILIWRLSFTSPTLCCKKIGVTSKITVLPSGTLSKMLQDRKFRHGGRSRDCCQ